jgi:hypothetical protein
MCFRWDQSIYSGLLKVSFWGVIEPECWVFKSVKSLGSQAHPDASKILFKWKSKWPSVKSLGS